jgi:hypothetical protein
VQAEHAQPSQVDRGGQQGEVGGDPGKAPDPHAAAAVAAADQMGQLALHLGPGRAVVGGTIRVGLAGASSGQLVFVGGDRDGAARRRAGAPAAKRAARTGRAEAGLAVVAVAWVGVVDDRGGAPCRAGDRAPVKVDPELVLGEVPSGRDGAWILT